MRNDEPAASSPSAPRPESSTEIRTAAPHVSSPNDRASGPAHPAAVEDRNHASEPVGERLFSQIAEERLLLEHAPMDQKCAQNEAAAVAAVEAGPQARW